MFTRSLPSTSNLFLSLLLVGILSAAHIRAEEGAQGKPPSKPNPWHRIQTAPFRVLHQLRGHLGSRSQKWVVFRSEISEKARIQTVVPHGTRVVKGATLLHIESDALRRSIASLRDEVELSDLALELEALAVQVADRKDPLDREASQRKRDQLEADFRHFQKTEKPQQITNSHRALERAEFSLEYSQEELQQLKQMYEADDLTEETEEIILKRAQRAVKNARHALEQTRWKQERFRKVSVPRDEEKRESDRSRNRIDHDAFDARKNAASKQRHRNLQKHQRQQIERKSQLARLQRDLEQRHIVSPSDGIVFHGSLRSGVWSGRARGLQRGQVIARNQTLMTVLDPSPQQMTASAVVSESMLGDLSPGLSGYALLPGSPATALPVKLELISWLPTKPGHHSARFAIEIPKTLENVRPSMSCQITLIIEETPEAITIPLHALDRDASGTPFVLVRTPEGKQRRSVRLGRVSGKRLRVLEGLAPGEEIWTGPWGTSR